MDSNFHNDVLNNDLFYCRDFVCQNPDHKRAISQLYSYLIDSLLESTDILSATKRKVFKKVPGWKIFCKEKYLHARTNFLNWKNSGMSRVSPEYNLMKNSRAEFRAALQQCRENEDYIRESQMVNAYENKDFKTFWRQVCVKRNFLSTSVDGKTEKNEISAIFEEKFFDILDDESCQTKLDSYREKLVKLKNIGQDGPKPLMIFFDKVKTSISKLNTAIDNDNIHTNHLKIATDNCILFITNLFNSMIQHCHVPKRMLCGEIRPIIKDKFGNSTDSNNFRPVMISSNFLKLFEYCIQPSLSHAFMLHDNQFGFREGTSTLMTTTVVKEVIHRYHENKSTVFAAFLDLSKGFDRVNHYTLLQYIFNSNLNDSLKLILNEFLVNQTAYVSYGDYHSDIHVIGNGVRQGGINSPLLFNFYLSFMMDDICKSKIGCQLALKSYSAIAYADDITLLAPSQSALQELLNMIARHLDCLDLKINALKTKIMVLDCRKTLGQRNLYKFYVNGSVLEVVENIKYLGVILNADGCYKKDIERVTKSFLRQSFACMHKFSNFPTHIRLFMFRTYCMSFYGSELWTDSRGCSLALSSLKISFHKSVKRLQNLPFRSSSHEACISAGLFTLEHIINVKKLSFGMLLRNTNSPCIRPIKNYLLNSSNWMKSLRILGNDSYNIPDILWCDRAAVHSRMSYLFMREPRYQGYVPSQS